MPEPTAERNVQTVRALSNDLAAFLNGLPEGVWRDPDGYASACAGWNVADVVTHLIQIANLKTLSIERALDGVSSPPMGYRRMDADERQRALAALRDAFFEDIFPEFNVSCLRFNRLIASLAPDQHNLPAWHPAATMTVSRLIGLRLMELAVHGWDIRYGFDRNAAINPIALPFLKSWIPNWLRAGFRAPRDLERPATLRFALTDAPGESHDLTVRADGFALSESSASAAPDTTISLDSSGYILFLMGRTPVRRALRRGRITVEGNQSAAERFGDWFRGI